MLQTPTEHPPPWGAFRPERTLVMSNDIFTIALYYVVNNTTNDIIPMDEEGTLYASTYAEAERKADYMQRTTGMPFSVGQKY